MIVAAAIQIPNGRKVETYLLVFDICIEWMVQLSVAILQFGDFHIYSANARDEAN